MTHDNILFTRDFRNTTIVWFSGFREGSVREQRARFWKRPATCLSEPALTHCATPAWLALVQAAK